MNVLTWVFTGGFAKSYRTQILGVTAALSAVGLWAVGDMALADLVTELPIILGALGLAALGAKVDRCGCQAWFRKIRTLEIGGTTVHAPFIGGPLGLPPKKGYWD